MLANTLTTSVAIIIAYLFGSISSAIIVCRAFGLPDPREQGSRNPGATNVMRIGGKGPAALTLLGDVLKGVIPVLIAKWVGLAPSGIALTALSAFIGHLFPLYFGFVGGKGVATFIGVLLAISWPTAMGFLITWLIVLLCFRYVAVASMSAGVMAPFFCWVFTQSWAYCAMASVMALIVIIRHHSNIRNIWLRQEDKIKGLGRQA